MAQAAANHHMSAKHTAGRMKKNAGTLAVRQVSSQGLKDLGVREILKGQAVAKAQKNAKNIVKRIQKIAKDFLKDRVDSNSLHKHLTGRNQVQVDAKDL